MTTLRTVLVGLVSVATAWAGPTAAQEPSRPTHSRPPVPLIIFSTDDFWLDLHHFLYVLGRAQAGIADAVNTGAPAEQEARLQTLTADERTRWRDAVSAYAKDFSRLDLVSDRQLVAITGALARVGNAATLDAARPSLPPGVASVLEGVAPAYRKAWWPEHRRANQQWVNETKILVDRHGPEVLAYITRAYQLPWPANGYPVHVCAYTNWAGAYSTDGPLLVVSSVDAGVITDRPRSRRCSTRPVTSGTTPCLRDWTSSAAPSARRSRTDSPTR